MSQTIRIWIGDCYSSYGSSDSKSVSYVFKSIAKRKKTMPRLFGVNMLGVVCAALLMLCLGYVWFVWLFPEANRLAFGWAKSDYMETNNSVVWRLVGFILEFAIAFGIGLLFKWAGVRGLHNCIRFSLVLASLIAIPPVSYHFAYGPYHDLLGSLQVAAHLIANFALAGAIMSKFEYE